MRFVSPTPRRSAAAVHAALSTQVIAVAALVVFEHARGRRLAREISALGGDPHAAGAQAVVGAVTVFAILIMFVTVTAAASAAAYLTWLVQARRSATPPGTGRLPVLAAWLVPGVNLVAPPLLVHRLWWDSRPPADRHGRWVALLAAWWLSWLTTLALVAMRLPFGAAPGDPNLTGLGPVELAAVAISALLCAATVRQITRIQVTGARNRYGTRAGDVAAPAAPAAPQFLGASATAAPTPSSPSVPGLRRRQSQALISSQPPPAVSKRSS
ncbi:DUF4328 domain-containing protein [Streptosporangium sp. NPDC051022]|uniref:DUF4328 domain-containing protein n=1 Tax=Streptosporangium sp. NPDC051022 TaxID=3155752 RepID=UPI003446B620